MYKCQGWPWGSQAGDRNTGATLQPAVLGRWRGSAAVPPPYDMYIIQSYPEQHNTLKKIYSYVQYL